MDVPTGGVESLLAAVPYVDTAHEACQCRPRFVDAPLDDRTDLVLDADDCPGRGDLAAERACRRTAIDALTERDAAVVRTRSAGRERVYGGTAAGLLLAAGRFVERARHHDAALAERCRTDPLGAARETVGRRGATGRIAAETGLALCAAEASDLATALDPERKLHVAREVVHADAPPGRERDAWETDTGASVRLVETGDGLHYHLRTPGDALDDGDAATLERARNRLAAAGEGNGRAAARAVRAVASEDAPVERLAAVLDRHTRGNGALDHCFADERVTDVVVSAPATANPVRVRVDGERAATNVHLSPRGAAALASTLRRTSGRPLSRAEPAVDAVLETPGGRVRAAAVTDPASDGLGFAFRTHEETPFRLPSLVANGTLSPDAAGLLSVATERGASTLVAGTRGAGKTTLLGALLWELPTATRTVVVEDTPELPVEALREAGRDVQPLRTHRDGDGAALAPTEAVRTALRLGEGALVVGEVRGEEASALYEAMRVGAAGSAVLGTVHGEGAAGVHGRVTGDLGVDERAFGATDLVVTCTAEPTRQVSRIEEVRGDGGEFVSLDAAAGRGLVDAGAVAEGRSELLMSLASPDETYADVRTAVARRADRLERAASDDHARDPEAAR
jgi:type IV secretory pathway ATPase VirB11/archaellum biosynthesis ATPase